MILMAFPQLLVAKLVTSVLVLAPPMLRMVMLAPLQPIATHSLTHAQAANALPTILLPLMPHVMPRTCAKPPLTAMSVPVLPLPSLVVTAQPQVAIASQALSATPPASVLPNSLLLLQAVALSPLLGSMSCNAVPTITASPARAPSQPLHPTMLALVPPTVLAPQASLAFILAANQTALRLLTHAKPSAPKPRILSTEKTTSPSAKTATWITLAIRP